MLGGSRLLAARDLDINNSLERQKEWNTSFTPRELWGWYEVQGGCKLFFCANLGDFPVCWRVHPSWLSIVATRNEDDRWGEWPGAVFDHQNRCVEPQCFSHRKCAHPPRPRCPTLPPPSPRAWRWENAASWWLKARAARSKGICQKDCVLKHKTWRWVSSATQDRQGTCHALCTTQTVHDSLAWCYQLWRGAIPSSWISFLSVVCVNGPHGAAPPFCVNLRICSLSTCPFF